jgi:preprotein translocase subunit SecA
MAGRGTDILLGGNPDVLAEDVLREEGFNPDLPAGAEVAEGEAPAPTDADRAAALEKTRAITSAEHDKVVAAGGLCVIGTERHESRRIDNQLRGRAGRQGDPGATQFYLSLEDDLMRLFAGDRMDKVSAAMERTNLPDDMPIQASIVTKAIEGAQRQVEQMNFAARKNVLEYDDVMNLQRAAIYGERNALLDGKDMSERVPEIAHDCVEAVVEENCPERVPSDDWDMAAVDKWIAQMDGRTDFKIEDIDHEDDPETVIDETCEQLLSVYEEKRALLGDELMRNLEAQVMLRIIDTRWMEHLSNMDYLRTGIGLRAFGQRDPLVEYKTEAHRAFGEMTAGMYESFLQTMLRLQIARKTEPAMPEEHDPTEHRMSYSSPEKTLDDSSMSTAQRMQSAARQAQGAAPAQPAPEPEKPKKAETYVKDKNDPYANVGRNDPCPCGSGKKFKKCHGRNRF